MTSAITTDLTDGAGALVLLANDLLSKALELRCSDMHVEPEQDCVVLRYLIDKKPIHETRLPKDVHSELAFCYKALVGMDMKQSGRPQDKRATIFIAGKEVTIRITAIPGEFGETIACSFKFSE